MVVNPLASCSRTEQARPLEHSAFEVHSTTTESPTEALETARRERLNLADSVWRWATHVSTRLCTEVLVAAAQWPRDLHTPNRGGLTNRP